MERRSCCQGISRVLSMLGCGPTLYRFAGHEASAPTAIQGYIFTKTSGFS